MFTMKSVWKRLLVAGLVIVGSLANAEHLEEPQNHLRPKKIRTGVSMSHDEKNHLQVKLDDMTHESPAVIRRDLHAILRETIDNMDLPVSASQPVESNSSDRDLFTTFGYCSDTPTCDPIFFIFKQHKMYRINGEGKCFEYCIFDSLLWFNAVLAGYKCGVCPP